MKTGDRVRDVYTGRIGVVIGYDALWNRAHVAFDALDGRPAFRMHGCASWFEVLKDEYEEAAR